MAQAPVQPTPVDHAPATPANDAAKAIELLVFSDDWGRHPSSCQHLIGRLLPRYRTLWVNTIGTRAPKLSREDLGKAAAKLRAWAGFGESEQAIALPENLRVASPRMYPGFRRSWQRTFNAVSIDRCVRQTLGPRDPNLERVAITTLPITADLPTRLPVDRWVYYCVDDFSVWPGLDGSVMDAMERELVRQCDAIAAVSQTLRDRLVGMGRSSTLLTHGIDLDHWTAADAAPDDLPAWWRALPRPIMLFWGVVDARLDAEWCLTMAQDVGSLVLMGPQQSPEPMLAQHPRITMPGPMPYASLPSFAATADVLVMPYADLPVTRAIQPLKFKEYLATGQPAVVRKLPATEPWADAADVMDSLEDMIGTLRTRLEWGVPDSQRAARERLSGESWDAKAEQLERLIGGG